MITRRIGRTQRVKIGGKTATYKYRHRKPGQGAGRVMAGIPQPEDNLLAWLDGATFGNQRIDAYTALGTYNFDMSKSACVSLDGVGDLGTLNSSVTLVGDLEISFEIDALPIGSQIYIGSATAYIRYYAGSYWRVKFSNIGGLVNFLTITNTVGVVSVIRTGTSVTLSVGDQSETQVMGTGDMELISVGYSNDRVNGKLYSLRLKDSTQDIHFRMAEKSGLTSFSDDYLNDGHYITWTAVEASLWAQTQDDYHGNSKGWWEINGDPVMYPYPVAGFDTYHKAGTFNGCETSYSPVSPVPPEIIAQDLLEGRFFTDISDNTVPRDQSEIEAFVVGKGASFFCEERGLKLYDEILTGQDLADAQGDCA